MRVMSAGQGYRYLLKSVVAADGNRDLSTPLTDYYTTHGTPPGRWLGSGVHQLGDGQIHPGDVVTEAQLQRLLGTGCDPVTGDPLGHAYPDYKSRQERIDARMVNLDPGLSADARATAISDIEAEEATTKTRRAVAGFDYTFSVPKSVSVLWAMSNEQTRAQIVAAHHAAIADVVGLMEREVAATRTGVATTEGAVAQVDVAGLIATAFDHYDSRTGDPQLHTHLVVSNKVKTVFDGKWRSLDGRPMHAAVVALSELYNGLLADQLTQQLGVGWQARERGRDRNPGWEITGIPDTLIDTFSSRAQAIDVEKDRLIADYRTKHGREPSATTIIKLRSQATLATRPDKTIRSLGDLTAAWQARARDVIGDDANDWAARLLASSKGQTMTHTADLSTESVTAVGRQVVDVVGEKRSTWRRWNLHAEASRQIMSWRFATTHRQTVLGLIVDAAEQASLRLTPPELASSPPEFRRADGSSVFQPKHSTVYTSAELLAAEDRLLGLARTTTGPALPAVTVEVMGRHDDAGRVLGADQLTALAAVAGSGRVVDVLVGPAGAGKTTALNALRRAWEPHHGPGSVVGLAPSAAAAQILADELHVATDNTAKWLYDHTNNGARFRTGQLVIIDEASLAGTHTLDRITGHAAQVGAKVLLVGDWAQLAAVEAGGAFGMLVRDRTTPPELTDVRRFHHDWEQQASLQLRHGDPGVIDTYQHHGRIRDGDTDTMLDRAFQAWQADLSAGHTSVMIAQTHDTVTALNTRARHDRILAGHVFPTGAVGLHDGTETSVGDQVITRRNNRQLTTGKGWVKNGDRWTVTATHHDGSIDVRRANHPRTSLRLPADYVAAHVELAYAVTAHRAQGATVDTVHTIIQPGMTRETLYVAMTRGRDANTAYVATDQPDIEPHLHPDEATGHSVLYGVLQHVGGEQSAHETITAQHDAAASIAQLAAEYETIAAAAQHHRWSTLIRQSGLTPTQADTVLGSHAFGPLTAELRRAEANHHNPETLLPQLIAARRLDDAHDIAAVLHHRVATATSRPTGTSRPRRSPRLIVGLIPEAAGPMTPEMRHALDERKHLIEQRVHALTRHAITNQARWIRDLGAPPHDPRRRQAWTRHVQTVSAYRDRYWISADSPLGPPANKTAQRADAASARAAMTQAQHVITVHGPGPTPHGIGQDMRRDGLSL